jgi:hypothetical protein
MCTTYSIILERLYRCQDRRHEIAQSFSRHSLEASNAATNQMND